MSARYPCAPERIYCEKAMLQPVVCRSRERVDLWNCPGRRPLGIGAHPQCHGTPYKPVPKTDLLIFSTADASWVDGKSLADAVRSQQLVFDPGVLWLEDGSRGPGIGTAGFQGPQNGGFFAMAIAVPGKPVKYLGTAYLPPASAKRELHCTVFKLGTLGGHTCP